MAQLAPPLVEYQTDEPFEVVLVLYPNPETMTWLGLIGLTAMNGSFPQSR